MRGLIRPPLQPVCRQAGNGGLIKGENMIEKSEFKGKPIIILKRSEDDQYPFSFGLSKAKLIMENLEEIKKFVQENSGG